MYGTCQVCGGLHVVKKDGTLRHHSDMRKPTNGLPWHPRCEGADKAPVKSEVDK